MQQGILSQSEKQMLKMRQKGVGIVDSLFFAERYLFIFFEKRFQWGAVEKIEGDEDISQWFYIIRSDAVYFLGKRKIEISFLTEVPILFVNITPLPEMM